MSNQKFIWDGEKIKRVVTQDEHKFTPKEIIDSLQQVRSQIDQMQSQKENMVKQQEQLEKNIKDAKRFEAQLREFEAKCDEIQQDKLSKLFSQIYQECKVKAEKDANEIISKDPMAYTEEQKKKMPYLNFQRAIATHPKVAEKISQHIIKKHLYEEPFFTNPFKEEPFFTNPFKG
jgi:cytochrome c1